MIVKEKITIKMLVKESIKTDNSSFFALGWFLYPYISLSTSYKLLKGEM